MPFGAHEVATGKDPEDLLTLGYVVLRTFLYPSPHSAQVHVVPSGGSEACLLSVALRGLPVAFTRSPRPPRRHIWFPSGAPSCAFGPWPSWAFTHLSRPLRRHIWYPSGPLVAPSSLGSSGSSTGLHTLRGPLRRHTWYPLGGLSRAFSPWLLWAF